MIPKSGIYNFYGIFFHPDDIFLMLGLKPSRSRAPDGYVWNHTKSGVYSVKTGYDLLRLTKLSLSHKGTVEPSFTSLQSHVWEIKAPSKMKHFLWQAIRAVWRRQRGSCIDTWALIGVVLDVLAQWSRLIIFFLNAHQLFRFGLYRTIRPLRVTSRVHPYIKT